MRTSQRARRSRLLALMVGSLALITAATPAAAVAGTPGRGATLVSSRTGAPTAPPGLPLAGRPGLSDAQPCAEATGFTCADLTVPLDRSGHLPGSLRLRVAASDNLTAPRGTLLFLTGGPGQPGVGLLPRITPRIGYLLSDYRLVVIDQRGTGPAGIDCLRLQAEVGSSDVTPPSPDAVTECAGQLGPPRAHYATADTVADLESLRRALGVSRWTLDGISYGTFVAQRYGRSHPDRVARMVLDSVVPSDGVPTLYADSMHRVGYVLRQACQEQSCGYDPAAELADVIGRYGNEVGIFDFLVTATIVDPKLTGDGYWPELLFLHLAAQGTPGPLLSAIEDLQGGENTPFSQFSSGLHAATFCAELADPPWGSPMAPVAVRGRALDRAVARIPADYTWPFPTRTAGEQGIAQTCRYWPPVRPAAPSPRRPLTMPVLLINGDRDLSTPLPWAQREAARMPHGQLVVVARMGHSIQGRNADGDRAVREFLLGPPR
ncbi:alpha/beta hydrolase [Plantactinospora siamensis]|uniref:Alpha/beta hydrolase n=1 Tax=Plantactinospora siamensis TaxID=555372 RepID=A0ABV6NPQ4_9ACTN